MYINDKNIEGETSCLKDAYIPVMALFTLRQASCRVVG